MSSKPFNRISRTVIAVLGIMLFSAAIAYGAMTKQVAGCAELVVANYTNSPISVYVDGEFVSQTSPFLKQTIQTTRKGKVRLVGRCLCDSWGPDTVTLSPGKQIVWKLGESNRHTKK